MFFFSHWHINFFSFCGVSSIKEVLTRVTNLRLGVIREGRVVAVLVHRADQNEIAANLRHRKAEAAQHHCGSRVEGQRQPRGVGVDQGSERGIRKVKRVWNAKGVAAERLLERAALLLLAPREILLNEGNRAETATTNIWTMCS